MKKTFLIFMLFIGLITGCAVKSIEYTLELGIKHINEGNYKEAILVFNELIKVDPNNEQYYLALADAYIRQNLFDVAQQVLQKGFTETNADKIKDKLKEFELGNITDGTGQIKKESAYNSFGELVWYRVYNTTYNSETNIHEGKIISYNSENNETSHCLVGVEKNEELKYMNCAYDQQTGELLQIIYYYNDLHEVFKTEYLDIEGNVSSYDLNIKIDDNTEKQEHYSYGKLHYYWIVTRDESIIKKILYDAEGNEGMTLITQHEGNKIIYLKYDKGELIEKSIRINEEDGHYTEEYYDSNDNLIKTIIK